LIVLNVVEISAPALCPSDLSGYPPNYADVVSGLPEAPYSC
jgi:hypothetical protein